jgi:hypothetical protein
MGRESAGGFLKLDLRDSIGDCAERPDAAKLSEVATRRTACGNLEDKRVMSVDYSGTPVGVLSATGPSRIGVERPVTVGVVEAGARSKTMIPEAADGVAVDPEGSFGEGADVEEGVAGGGEGEVGSEEGGGGTGAWVIWQGLTSHRLSRTCFVSGIENP